MILTCLGAACLLSPLNNGGPTLLFLGLLTLLNAPFDWASLGPTRVCSDAGSNLEGGGLMPWRLWKRVSPQF
jgi:hypothetical protein